MGDFDYVQLASSDDIEPVSLTELIGSMRDLEEEQVSMFHCSYGDPGTHKTTETMEMVQGIVPEDQKIVYIDSGKGWISLMNFPHLMRRVKRIQFRKYEQILALQQLLSNPDLRKKANIGAVVFDEWNRMQDMDIMRLTKARAERNNSDAGKRAAGNKWKFKDPSTPEWPEYNATKARMVDNMTTLLAIPDLHIFFICHTRIDKDTQEIVPDFPKGAGSAFLSMVHSCYYFAKKEVQQNGQTVLVYPIETFGGSLTVSKNRIGTLPRTVYSGKVIAEHYTKWASTKKAEVADSIPGEIVPETPEIAPVIETPVVETPTVPPQAKTETEAAVSSSPKAASVSPLDDFDLDSIGL
jgi:hypothetical protein